MEFVFAQIKSLQFLGNTPTQWLLALLVAILLFTVFLTIRRIATRKLRALAEKTDNKIDDTFAEVFERTNIGFLIVLAIYGGTFMLDLGTYSRYVRNLMIIVLHLQVGFWAIAAMNFGLKSWQEQREGDAAVGTTSAALGFLGKGLIWTVIFLLVLDNLGVKVSSLLAGLGVGGIAVALAVQKILGDLFASVSIMLDKPFEIGDFILVGDMSGTVEHIGLKTTRMRSISGEQLVFANSDLLGSRIRNYKRMSERRILFTLDVTYQTPAETLAQIPTWIQEIIQAQEKTRFDRAHFSKFAPSALVFEAVYWVTEAEYLSYMDINQAINLALVRKFELEKVKFAYPTQTLYVNSSNE